MFKKACEPIYKPGNPNPKKVKELNSFFLSLFLWRNKVNISPERTTASVGICDIAPLSWKYCTGVWFTALPDGLYREDRGRVQTQSVLLRFVGVEAAQGLNSLLRIEDVYTSRHGSLSESLGPV